ncbi:myelin protein P0 isoform X5 [Danio aesculapii]|uniref:myelin protein P0 isoform X5 n=1 Tax=Danio aesculapii TaxID=1142201 RepID=UPI0024C0B553|nr:myelin protein P0 isoform X5 [Danio aesculapii]
MLSVLALTSVVLLGIASQSTALVVYTNWEKHALVGSDVRLSCSFFSWQWTSPDVSFTWQYRQDGAKDSISIFHYAGGEAYPANKGPFQNRLEFVGNPSRRDGSILIKDLDFGDNGTFTCDAKNPPDIAGHPSTVRLLVFEKANMARKAKEKKDHSKNSVSDTFFWSFFYFHMYNFILSSDTLVLSLPVGRPPKVASPPFIY